MFKCETNQTAWTSCRTVIVWKIDFFMPLSPENSVWLVSGEIANIYLISRTYSVFLFFLLSPAGNLRQCSTDGAFSCCNPFQNIWSFYFSDSDIYCFMILWPWSLWPKNSHISFLSKITQVTFLKFIMEFKILSRQGYQGGRSDVCLDMHVCVFFFW